MQRVKIVLALVYHHFLMSFSSSKIQANKFLFLLYKLLRLLYALWISCVFFFFAGISIEKGNSEFEVKLDCHTFEAYMA